MGAFSLIVVINLLNRSKMNMNMNQMVAPVPEQPKKRGGGFAKDVKLSPELTALVGSDRMPRFEIIKKLWQIIRARKLQDPSNRQYIMLRDPDMMLVFREAGTDRIKAFSMMKYLKSHITPL